MKSCLRFVHTNTSQWYLVRHLVMDRVCFFGVMYVYDFEGLVPIITTRNSKTRLSHHDAYKRNVMKFYMYIF